MHDDRGDAEDFSLLCAVNHVPQVGGLETVDDVFITIRKPCFYCFYAIPTSFLIFVGNVFLILVIN